MGARQTFAKLYADRYRSRFASQEGAVAHFESVFDRRRLKYRFTMPGFVPKLFLLACMGYGFYILMGYDYEQVYDSVFDTRGSDLTIALVLDDNTRTLFKPEAIEARQVCLRGPSHTCLMRLQDVRTRPQIMVNPDTRVNDVCRALAKSDSYFGLPLEYEFALTEDAGGREATRCVLTNEAEVHRRDILELWRPAAALALNFIGLIGLLLI